MYYVYAIKCGDERFYVGCTNDLQNRIERYNKAQIPATKNRLLIKLITYIVFNRKHTAFEFEKYLKSGSGRAFLKKHFI